MAIKEFTGKLDQPKVSEFKGTLDKPDYPSMKAIPEGKPLSEYFRSTEPEIDLKPKFSFQLPYPQKATGGEAIAQEVIGGTIGSVIAPEVTIPRLLSKAPGLVRTIAMNSPKIAAASAGTGAAGGDPAAAAIGEVTGLAAINALQKVAAPFRGKISEGTKKLVEFARKENIPLSPEAIRPSMVNRIIAGGNDMFLPTRLVNRYYRGKMVQRMNELSGKLNTEGIAETGTQMAGKVAPGREIMADLVNSDFGETVSGLRKQAIASGNEFINSIGADAKINVFNTRQALEKIQKNIKQEKVQNFVNQELSSLGQIKRAEDLDTLYKEIGAIKGAKSKAKLYLGELKDAIKKDFEIAGADVKLFNKSNQDFGRVANLTNNQFLRQLAAGEVPPNAITVRLFNINNPNSISNIKKLKSVLPAETFESLKAQNIANLIMNHSAESTQAMGVRVINKGERLAKWVADNRKVLEEAYTPQQMQAIQNFAEIAKLASKDVKQFEKDITNLGLANAAAAGGGIYAGQDIDPALVLTGTGIGLMAKSMINPKGWLNKYLTTGFEIKPAMAQAMKMGIRASAQNQAQQQQNQIQEQQPGNVGPLQLFGNF